MSLTEYWYPAPEVLYFSSEKHSRIIIDLQKRGYKGG